MKDHALFGSAFLGRPEWFEIAIPRSSRRLAPWGREPFFQPLSCGRHRSRIAPYDYLDARHARTEPRRWLKCAPSDSGALAERLRSGLQHRLCRFDSGTRLQLKQSSEHYRQYHLSIGNFRPEFLLHNNQAPRRASGIREFRDVSGNYLPAGRPGVEAFPEVFHGIEATKSKSIQFSA